MRKIFVAFVVGVFLIQDCTAVALLTEAFDYNASAGTGLSGLGGWTAGAQATIQDTNLTFAGLTNPPVTYDKKTQLSTANGLHSRTFNPSAIGTGSVYVSFLIKLTTLHTTDGYFWPVLSLDNDASINLNSGTGFRQARAGLVVYCRRTSSTTYGLGIRKNEGSPTAGTTTWGSASFTVSDTVLVVGKYTYGAGAGDDTVTLWLNPATLGAVEDAAPAVAATTSANTTDSAALQYVVLVSASTGNGGGMAEVDNIRVGTNWVDVIPSGGTPPPPPPPASTNTPYFTQTLMSAQGIVLRGINGTTNGIFNVLATSNLALPRAQWTAIATNTFDSNGNFNSTNPLPPGVPQQFYALRLGSNDVSSPIAPQITSQPQSNSAAIGENVLFSVTVTGTAPLSYQWFFNTNTSLPTGTNSSYTISSVTSNDAGGYSVIVTNIAGSATSSVAALTIAGAPTNGDFFISPSGSDSNPGTLAAPFATLPKAISLAQPGNIIYVRGGTHSYSSTIRITNSGTAGSPIKLWAYPGEHPLIDFSAQLYGSNNRGILIPTNGNYWEFKGLEIAHAGDNAVKVEGSHHRFEQCVFHHNGDTGLQIGFGHDDDNPGANLAAFIEVINCDSYRNYDSDNRGSDADGFAAKLHCGQGIIFIGCRAWENSDDAWDLFETDASVVISNCWAWHSGDGALFPGSGSFQGNGNGIKLGGNGAGGSSMGTHYAYNCIAFNNNYKSSAQGFTQNSHKDGEVIVNCLSYGSSGYNYFFEGGINSGKANVFTNNVSIPRAGQTTGISFDPPTTEVNNSWNLPVTASAADYGDLSETAAAAPRKPDGSLPDGFARLVTGSDLIDKGVNVGQPFNGTAPDLGPYEYSP